MAYIHRKSNSVFNAICWFFLSITFLLSACAEDDLSPPPVPSYLSSFEELSVVPASTIKPFASFFGLEEYQNLIDYDITLYKISYQSTYWDEAIVASGLIAVPTGKEGVFPLLSAHHGTIFSNADAPSNFSIPNHVSGFEFLASLGYIILIPDYLGYGDSQNLLHPYYDFDYTAGAVTDFILAAKEFLPEINQEENGQLFLLGYSEGGYATIAALKAIEENSALDMEVTAAAAGAGGYNIENMLAQLTTRKTYAYPAYLALIISAYNITNQWNRPLTDFFREPYASRLESLLEGSQNGNAINAQLNDTLEILFTPGFLTGLKEGTETTVIDAFRANSVHNWAPHTPLRLYHEQDDEIIPIANSANTFAQMQENGSSAVTYVSYDEADSHSSGFQPMMERVIPWFESLKETP